MLAGTVEAVAAAASSDAASAAGASAFAGASLSFPNVAYPVLAGGYDSLITRGLCTYSAAWTRSRSLCPQLYLCICRKLSDTLPHCDKDENTPQKFNESSFGEHDAGGVPVHHAYGRLEVLLATVAY